MLDSGAAYDEEIWHAVTEMGWTGTAVEEQYGGVGMGHLELCVIAEELGRCLAPIPFSSSVYLSIEALKLAGSEAQRAAWLPKLAQGEAIGTLAVVEGPGPLRIAGIRTRWENGRLSGSKQPYKSSNFTLCELLCHERTYVISY